MDHGTPVAVDLTGKTCVARVYGTPGRRMRYGGRVHNLKLSEFFGRPVYTETFDHD